MGEWVDRTVAIDLSEEKREMLARWTRWRSSSQALMLGPRNVLSIAVRHGYEDRYRPRLFPFGSDEVTATGSPPTGKRT